MKRFFRCRRIRWKTGVLPDAGGRRWPSLEAACVVLTILFFPAAVIAQHRAGNIHGRVLDRTGNPLAGVAVTLTGSYTAPQTHQTTEDGSFRFLSLPPAKDYSLKCERAGFKTRIDRDLQIQIGRDTTLTLELEEGAIEETITVVAEPPKTDPRRIAIETIATRETLQSMPSARDPWVILQSAPSVIVDRENVGGSESGQQALYVAKGADTQNNNVWSIDGIVITDPSAAGGSPSYFDFDAFEEMQITVGGADVTVQTGGVALNMVTRRGGNAPSFGGRFYVTDEKFQAQNTREVADLKQTERFFSGINRIIANKDYGFEIGLPLRRDKAWFWGSYGVQDLKTSTVYGTRDEALLENYAAKLNLQLIPQNRLEVFLHFGGKKTFGRSTSAENPEGLYQQSRYHFGSPIVKFQDEQMFGENLFVSLKYAYTDAGFSLVPMTDTGFDKLPVWDVAAQRYFGSQASRYYVERPVNQYDLLINYFRENLLGASHDIKLGVEYSDRNQYVEDVWSGNCLLSRNYNTPVADFSGSGLPEIPPGELAPYFSYFKFQRGYYAEQHVDGMSGFLSDTVGFGRFNVVVGFRLDKQTPWLNPYTVKAMDGSAAWDAVAPEAVQQKMDALLPGVMFPKVNAVDSEGGRYNWTVFSPRIGVSWDVNGDGRTIAKISLATYGDFMSTSLADRWRKGGADGWLGFWWWDADTNASMALDELYWTDPADYRLRHVFDGAGNFIGDWNAQAGLDWGGYDPQDPAKITDSYLSTEKGAGSSRTTEMAVSLEQELTTDFSVSLVGTFRKYGLFSWTLDYFKDAAGGTEFQNRSWYVSAGRPAGSYPGIGDTKEAQNHEWYYLAERVAEYTPWSQVRSRPDYDQRYFGLDVVLNKRLSHGWMLNAAFTWQKQSQHFGDAGFMDPTNVWALDGRPQAAYLGSDSGKIDQYIFPRWMLKANALIRLPRGFDLSLTLNAREGWIIREYFQLVDYTLPSPKSRSSYLDITPFGSERLPAVALLNMRLEKMVALGDKGKIYLMADLFNVLNSMVASRRYQKFAGTYYVYPDSSRNNFVPYPNRFALNEVVNPRILRLGIRFAF